MIAYKAFNKNLEATMGRGTYKFEPGKTYEETECKCSKNGFHCAENPLCCLTYYTLHDSRYFIVDAAGDINQDGTGSRISCTKLTLLKELSRIELAVHACRYIQKHPERELESRYAQTEKGTCTDDFIIVRGKKPVAKGFKGSYLFLMQEEKAKNSIKGIYVLEIDGKEYKPDTYYTVREGRVEKYAQTKAQGA